MTPLRPWFKLLFIGIALLVTAKTAQASCVDSVRLNIRSVQCYGLRNGAIIIDSVYGGEKPFYFSIDGLSFSTRPVFEDLWSGNYTLYVRDASGCVYPKTAFVPEPEDLVVKIFTSDTLVERGVEITLRAEVTPDNTALRAVYWRPPYLFSSPKNLEQSIRLSESTTIAIEVQDLHNCIARDHIDINVDQTNVYFPNAIKTNSNSDAYFTAFAGEGVATITNLQIYNRAGGLVFERQNFPPNDPLKGWNGRSKGKLVQPGVYPYIAVIEYLDGRKKAFQGSVTVIN
jgi:hypothetical protein